MMLTICSDMALAVAKLRSTCNASPLLKLGFELVEMERRVTNRRKKIRATCFNDIFGHSFLERSEREKRKSDCLVLAMQEALLLL